MITTPEIITIMGTALVVVSGCLGWAAVQFREAKTIAIRAVRAAETGQDMVDSLIAIDAALVAQLSALRAENRALKGAETKRQAQRIAASAAAARARAAKRES